RVRRVKSNVGGPTSRMYHRQVSSSPRFVDAIIDSSDGAPEASDDITRLSTAGVTGSPASPAEYRLACSAVSTPEEIHGARPAGSPVSNTDQPRPGAAATPHGGPPG